MSEDVEEIIRELKMWDDFGKLSPGHIIPRAVRAIEQENERASSWFDECARQAGKAMEFHNQLVLAKAVDSRKLFELLYEAGSLNLTAEATEAQAKRIMKALVKANIVSLTDEIRDAPASGSNPVSKDGSMVGRGVDPMLRGATSPALTSAIREDEK